MLQKAKQCYSTKIPNLGKIWTTKIYFCFTFLNFFFSKLLKKFEPKKAKNKKVSLYSQNWTKQLDDQVELINLYV